MFNIEVGIVDVRDFSVLLYSKYGRLGPSSRLRMLQYLPHLARREIVVSVCSLFPDRYVRAIYGTHRLLGKVSAGAYYPQRIAQMLLPAESHVNWIQGELLPYAPSWLEKILLRKRRPYVVDYDDALFHRYDLSRHSIVRGLLRKKIDCIMRGSSCVVAGNAYLAQRAIDAGAPRVEIVPTVVDPARYASAEYKNDRRLTVGWIGSPATEGYLVDVAPALVETCIRYDARLLLVGARPEIATKFEGATVEVASWSEAGEAALLAQMDVGIMPLLDTPWERGKCGYKLIQYMASSVPFIASPVGVNTELAADGRGILAGTLDEWHAALDTLLSNPQLRVRMGRAGRSAVCEKYSIDIQAPRLAAILHAAAGF